MTKKKRSKNKALIIISKTLGTGVIICTVLLLLLLAIPRLLGYEIYNVVSGSMQPAIGIGDLILVKDINPEDLKEGDIIAYIHNDVVICHRVIENSVFAGKITTKGDANENEDPEMIDYYNVIGIVEHNYPFMGAVGEYVSSVSGKLLIIELLVIGVLLNVVSDRLR